MEVAVVKLEFGVLAMSINQRKCNWSICAEQITVR